jgi:hypothetical protein
MLFFRCCLNVLSILFFPVAGHSPVSGRVTTAEKPHHTGDSRTAAVGLAWGEKLFSGVNRQNR